MMMLKSLPVDPTSTTVPAKTVLLARHAVPTQGYYLTSGRVVTGLMENGALKHRMTAFNAPCWLNASAVLLEQRSAADWVAETELEVQTVPAAALRAWFETLPDSVRMLVRDMAVAQQEQTDAVLAMLVKDAEARFADWLLRHAQTLDGGGMALQMRERKRNIAGQLGIAPETLSRILRHFRELGFISQSGSSVQLLNPHGLAQRAGV